MFYLNIGNSSYETICSRYGGHDAEEEDAAGHKYNDYVDEEEESEASAEEKEYDSSEE